MSDRQAYIAFNLTDRIGPAKLERLAADAGGSVAAAWEAYPDKVSRTGGKVDVAAEEEQAKRYGVRIVTPADDCYPSRLRGTPGSPLALYVKGDVAALSKPMVAIVGTRRATPYGHAVAHRLAADLASAGWCVVSGLALGIDADGHRGALDAKGLTVGVIGSGLDRFYPERNRDLAREIVAKGGAVASQFPFGRPADEQTFPIRNHVVAALAQGVVAVECPMKSGTLITTGIAADLGRPVMAVPGPVDSHMSAGCLDLIRNGATLVRNADDVIEMLSPLSPRNGAKSSEEKPVEPDPERPPYSVEESLVMLHVEDTGTSMDELVAKTGLSARKVNSIAMSLRLKGFVRFLPGNRIAPPR